MSINPALAQALREAQTPAEYARAAQAAGLTADAQDAALAGARPVAAPDFAAQLAQLQRQNATLQAQMTELLKQQPVPVNPAAAAVANVELHVKALLRRYPNIEGGPLLSVLETAVSEAGKL
jgi:hypothetical protein